MCQVDASVSGCVAASGLRIGGGEGRWEGEAGVPLRFLLQRNVNLIIPAANICNASVDAQSAAYAGEGGRGREVGERCGM